LRVKNIHVTGVPVMQKHEDNTIHLQWKTMEPTGTTLLILHGNHGANRDQTVYLDGKS
jgi:hypothetical protein